MRYKACKNCKFWKRYNDVQGTCSRSKITIDGDFVNSQGKTIENKYDSDRVIELVCQAGITYYCYSAGNFNFLPSYEILDDIQIMTGHDFWCCYFEKENEKIKNS